MIVPKRDHTMKQYAKHMKMSELSARTKITAATIRNYARQGLLSEPIKTGKTMAYYTVEHIDRLKKIQSLQKNGHSLNEIKHIVNQNSTNIRSNRKLETVYTSKRNVIIKAAVDLFRDKGYDNTNIDDIVAMQVSGKAPSTSISRARQNCFTNAPIMFSMT